MINKSLFSSEKETWETPIDLFNLLNSVFNFKIDTCALENSAKCPYYFTPDFDGLKYNWCSISYWCNPPYGRSQIDWVTKACNDSKNYNSMVVCLIPARCDTKLWQDIIFPNARAICFIKGRLKFGDSKNSAPFPSGIIVFSNNNLNIDQINILCSLGYTIINNRKINMLKY